MSAQFGWGHGMQRFKLSIVCKFVGERLSDVGSPLQGRHACEVSSAGYQTLVPSGKEKTNTVLLEIHSQHYLN